MFFRLDLDMHASFNCVCRCSCCFRSRQSKTDAVVYAIDRVPFRRLMLSASSERFKENGQLLAQIPDISYDCFPSRRFPTFAIHEGLISCSCSPRRLFRMSCEDALGAGQLSPGYQAMVAEVVETVSYPAGTVIVKQGDPGDSFYIIKSVCRESHACGGTEWPRYGGGSCVLYIVFSCFPCI